MLRTAILITALILAGCGKSTVAAEPARAGAETPAVDAALTDAAAKEPWPAEFPKPTADYAGVYDFSAGGQSSEVKIAASGARQRIIFSPGSRIGGVKGDWSQVMVNEITSGKMLVWPEGDGAPAIATAMSRRDMGAMATALGVQPSAESTAKRTGTDNIAGLECAIWEFGGTEGEKPDSGCVTRDGIPLKIVSGGQTVMVAKSIKRGRQDPALFAPPAGYEVVDMGECMRLGAEMMSAARAGKTPDMAKMEKCQAIGEKMGAMYGEQ